MWKFLLAGMALAALSGAPCMAGQDGDFLAAREAFQSGDARRLEQHAKRLHGYELEPYVAYWQLRLRLDRATPQEVQDFLAHHRGELVAERMRVEWLKALGEQQKWDLFAATYPQVSEADVELKCYALQSRLARKDSGAWVEARRVWLSGSDLPDSCTAVFKSLARENLLVEEDVWARLRLVFEAGNVSVAKHVVGYFPAAQKIDQRKLDSVAENPQRYFDKKRYDLKSRLGREVAIFAVGALARSSPQQAARAWQKIEEGFAEEDRRYVWGRLAYYAAREHDPDALAWFDRAGRLSDDQLAWKARAGLRARNWAAVRAALEAMSPAGGSQPAWRYWRARAMKAQGEVVEANALLLPLSTEYHYYGQLATEELGAVISRPAESYRPSQEEVEAIRKLPGIQRALEFYRIGLRYEGNLEWQFTVANMTDQQLIAAAELAQLHGLYDRAINTANKTVRMHDFNLRYLAPYRDVMQSAARELDLDEAWVYGLIRQESRFVSSARSGVGATGLMQLMPTTARWVAKQLGMRQFRPSLANELNTNVKLGAYYLKHILGRLDNQPLLASAAYNAGPRRAREWRDEGRAMEGAIYAETIPFTETRDYVKKVMSNTVYYAMQFDQKIQNLKQRLGVVPARGREEPLADDEP
ncbi:MAG: transglycosylase SLT domain-containing protein [Pseudomonadota bacterium]